MIPEAEILCIGTELTSGHTLNTNARFISEGLAKIGMQVNRHAAIPDKKPLIISSIKESLARTNLLITTGGLGPTVDDLTLECISEALNKRLYFNKKIAGRIREHFKRRKIEMPANNLRQALLPEGTRPIPNYIGTAPGLIVPIKNKLLIALPGVPSELYPMFEKKVLPYLKKRFPEGLIIKSRIIKITGLAESKVNELIEDILRSSGDVELGIYPHPEEIHVKITTKQKNEKTVNLLINKIEKKVKFRLKDYIFGYDNEGLEEIVGRALLKSKKNLAIAESCTGGLLASRITDVPGSSEYFKLGIVAYSNESKNKLLNIPMKIIKRYGAVSRQIVSLMAKNVRILAGTNYGIGISGIAGPGGATKKKPVGLVYIAVSTKEKTICKEFRFIGLRNIIKHKSTQVALNMIRKVIHNVGEV